jgi:hypothetical protein
MVSSKSMQKTSFSAGYGLFHTSKSFFRSPFLASPFGAIKVLTKYQTVENIDLVDNLTTTYGT